MLAVAGAIVYAPPVLAQSTGTLTGILREDSTARPIASAEISIDALKRSTVTDANGRFVLSDIAAGIRTISIRRLGYRPRTVEVAFLAGEIVDKPFTLTIVPAALDTLRVRAGSGRVLIGYEAFYDRRDRGFGKLLDSADLAKFPGIQMSSLLEGELGVRVVHPPPCAPYSPRKVNCVSTLTHAVAMASGGGNCAMKVMLDDMIMARGGQIDGRETAGPASARHSWYSTFDLTSVNLVTLEKVELYRRAAEVPPEYQSDDIGCGLLVMWSRR